MKNLTAVLVVLAMLAGCASKREYIPQQEAYSYDKNTSFAMQEESDGFMLTVDYAKEPSFLEFHSAIAKQCKSQLTSIARELSDKTGRKIKPVNEERITISVGDDDNDARKVHCHAQVKVEWE